MGALLPQNPARRRRSQLCCAPKQASRSRPHSLLTATKLLLFPTSLPHPASQMVLWLRWLMTEERLHNDFCQGVPSVCKALRRSIGAADAAQPVDALGATEGVGEAEHADEL